MAAVSASDGVSIHNETNGTQSRYTRAGQKLTYSLNILQQPQRARACGQGAKSSSDRRPVDPPPIIECRIHEGEDASRDITFIHNASLFLYAHLENARPIAQGRMPPTPSNTPVLTGSNVTGISYLDRPSAAGYFIFPDLSVRHEGKYRLTFTLYEEVKNPHDMDSDSSPDEGVGSHVYARCEVKSTPFDVFSAKKFPGLMESTMLSRTVADQGCRVRIRRDVRLRRVESKNEKEWADYPQQPQSTQLGVGDRDKSSATTSPQEHEQSDPRPNLDGQSANQTLPAPPGGAAVPHNSYQQQQYPFNMHAQAQQQPSLYAQGGPYDHQQQSAAYSHPQQYQGPQYMPQQAQYPVGQYPGYQQGYFPQAAQHAGAPMVQPPAYGYAPQQQQQMMPSPYAPQQPYVEMRQDGQVFNGAYPGNEQQSYAGHAQMNAVYGSMEQQQQTMMQQQQQHQQPQPQETQVSRPSLPTNKSGPQQRANAHVSPPTANDAARHLSAMNQNEAHKQQQQQQQPAPQFYTTPAAGAGAKRSYGSSFNTTHIEKPLRSGARPALENGVDEAELSDEDLQDLDSLKISYRRADGTYTTVAPRMF